MQRTAVLAVGILTLATVATAQRLPDLVVPRHYELTFAPDLVGDTFTGRERIDVDLQRSTSAIVLNALELELRDVRIEQRNASQPAVVAIDKEKEQATLTVDRPLAAGPASIFIEFEGRLTDNLQGLYLSRTASRKYVVSQFESTDARRAFPSFDEPGLKATFAVTAIVDEGDTAISNGAIASDTPGPGAGKHTLRFSRTAKMSTYLVALAVGDFRCLQGSADRIPIRVCTLPDKVELGRFALSAAEYILAYFNRYFETDYPFGKLDILAVPDFAAGAMENTAAIFGRERLLLADEAATAPTRLQAIASVVSHEIVHHWFGDLVTPRWWDDIWLNEGFATWMEMKPVHEWRPEWRMPGEDVRISRTAVETDALQAARPIKTAVDAAADSQQLFDPLSYQKAAAVLEMTEQYIGFETFRRGVNAYVKKYSNANSTAAEFWSVMTDVTGRPVDRIIKSFVERPGIPVLDVTARCEKDRTIVDLRQQRFLFDPFATGDNSLWSLPICLKADGQSTCTLLERKEQTVTVKGCPTTVFANPSAHGYYISAYDPALLERIASSASAALNAAERAVLVDDTWALVRRGRYQIGDLLNIVAEARERLATGEWDVPLFRLQYIADNLVDETTAMRFAQRIRQVVRPAFDRLGWDAGAKEPMERRAARAAIVSVLGRAGRDPDVLTEARRRADRYLSGNLDTDPMMLDAIVSVAASAGDRALHDRLLAKAASQDPAESRRALQALSQFADPGLVRRTLEFAVSPAARIQDVPTLLGGALRNPASRELAWQFVKDRWSDVNSKTEGPFGSIVVATSSFCDARLRDDVSRFFAEHPLAGSDRPLREALESVDGCIRLKEQQGGNLSRWLQ